MENENKELIEFRQSIEKKLHDLGFKASRDNWNTHSNSYTLGDELQRIKNEKYDFYTITGHNLYVDEVQRSNGTKANISYYISIMEWHNSNGHGLEKIKVSYKDSKKKQERLINGIINHYIEMFGKKENQNEEER